MMLMIVIFFLEIVGQNPIFANLASVSKLFTIVGGKRFKTSFDSFTAESRIDCCSACVTRDGCLAVNYESSAKECQFVPLPLLAYQLSIDTESAGNWDVQATDDWLLVFRGTARSGNSLYDAWVSGTNVVTHDANCMRLDQTTCTSHYRNTIVNSWASIGITRVKLSLFKDGEEKHFITFDGTGTDHLTWFDDSKILTSSWTNLKSESFNYFSIEGFKQRTFYISTYWGGCPADVGYLVISTEAPDGTWTTCSFDNHADYPTITYAAGDTGGAVFDSTGVEEADFIAISISTS